MIERDFQQFAAAMASHFEALSAGREQPLRPSASATVAWFKAFEPFALETVLQAFVAHLRVPATGRTFPIPGDIVAQIEKMVENDDRPGADEAWATAMQGRDEAATIVWTSETAAAWGIVQSLQHDKVAARLAFVEAYRRIVEDARRSGRGVKWLASLGSNPGLRRTAITLAVGSGQLDRVELAALPSSSIAAQIETLALPALGDSEAAKDGKQRLQSALVNLKEWQALAALRIEERAIAERAATRDRKDREAAKFAEYVSNSGGVTA
jgi:hypothetical protein